MQVRNVLNQVSKVSETDPYISFKFSERKFKVVFKTMKYPNNL